MKIPKSQIVTGKYTMGKEFVLLPAQTPYQGYYYELNNKTFAGKDFNYKAPEIIKITSDKFNPLLSNPKTKTYATITQIKPEDPKIKSIPFAPTPEDLSKPFIVRYFAKKLNNTPISIKEISEENFNEIQFSSIYQTLKVNFTYHMSDKELNDLDKTMPGIKAFLSSDEPRTSGKEPTTV
jgi:hypothetical protein